MVGVIEPGVIALEKKLQDKNAHILIIGTRATISSHKYQTLLKKRGFHNITAKATPLFVPLVEEEIFEGEILEAAMRHYFGDMRPDAVILGCTHFPLITKVLKSYFGHKSLLIHSGEAIVEYLQEQFPLTPAKNSTTLKLFASENPEKLKKIAQSWLGR